MGFAVKPALLSSSDMERIHEASLYLLEKKGVVFRSEEAIELFRGHGAQIDGQIVHIPRSLVESSLKTTPSRFRLEAINPQHSLTIGEGLAVHPTGGEVFVSRGNRVRDKPTIQDFEDIQKIYQACTNINFTGYQPMVPLDVPQSARGLLCTYATMLYTDKPWLAPMDFVGRKEKHKVFKLYEIVFGKDYMDTHYVTWNVVSPESPFVLCDIACESILTSAEVGQPICFVSAPMSGISAPIHSLSTILLQNAETLAAICLVQMAHPGLPVLPSASLTYGNLRYATWECACPDTALMLAGGIQMYKDYYNFPTRAQTGVTSSKCVDYQAGFETMQSFLLCALLDVNVTSQSVGSLENLLTTSFEKTVLDDEIVSRVRRICSGIEIDDEHLGVDILMGNEHGQDFLIHDSTLKYLYENWQPSLSDWNSYENWSAHKHPNIYDRASAHIEEILNSAKQLLDSSIAERLRQYIDST